MKNKKGISLITLIITIVFIIIFAGAIVLELVENDLIGKSKDAKKASIKIAATDEVHLSTDELFLQHSLTKMTQEEKRTYLEEKLRQYEEDSTVEISGTGFLATHRGYLFEISDSLDVTEKVEFNPEEWDKIAEEYVDLFEWDETGTIIIGYKDALKTYVKIRVPSKCVAIIPTTLWQNNNSTRDDIVGGIIKVELPDTITTIGNCAFADFSSLEEINIPDSVTVIDNYAFSRCFALTNITLPDNLNKIADHTFFYCENLTSVNLSKNITSIGKYAFYGCKSLTDINIPDSVTSIGNYVFSDCTSLTSITIPDSVTSIGSYIFSDCTSLTNVTLSNSLTSIPSHTFYGCKNLINVTIPDSVTSIGQDAFAYCSSLKDIILPSNLKEIGSYAFYICTGLTSINIPDSLTEIGMYAFWKCTNLPSIIIPNNVTYISGAAFGMWTANQTIYLRTTYQPTNWSSLWNESCNANIEWGYTGE